MRIRFHCPHCPAQIDANLTPADDSDLSCPTCGKAIPLDISDSLRDHNEADRCPICSGAELYYRKNFPQGLGALIIVIAGLASFYFLWQRNMLMAWAFPLTALVFDMGLYFIVRMATCCYRCGAILAGVDRHESTGSFDLATAEKYGTQVENG
ncbi:MAG: MnhB domain-containing protein [Planctomycetes bacterium]|nr:MnhB domain-containing protein [Planctomycetota bacterium]